MKVQHKAASMITLFGIVIVLLLSLGYDAYSQRIVIDKEMDNISNISKEVASHLESHLREKSAIAMTLSAAPLIKDGLLKSNQDNSRPP